MTPDAPLLILASGSPRRRDLLTGAGLTFDVRPPDVDERAHAEETPTRLVHRLALEKARAVALRSRSQARVLAADTLVVLDGQVLGKPRDRDEAHTMLEQLSGRTHRVLTGFAFVWREAGVEEVGVETSEVTFRTLETDEIRAYVETEEPLDKAGAYAVQGGAGQRFVTRIQGSRSNVIGLPLEVVVPLLARHGVASR